MKLSDVKCRNAKGKPQIYKLSDGMGLYLLVKPNSSKLWRYKYRIDGKEKVYSLGQYPQVSLQEAREEHRKAHKSVSEGIDPSLIKIQTKILNSVNNGNTFAIITAEWLEIKKEEVRESTFKDIENRITKNLLPFMGNMPINSINTPIIIAILKKVEDRGSYYMVSRLSQSLVQIFRYAIAIGKVERNPALDISGAFKKKKTEHHKSMPLDKLAEFLKSLDRNTVRLYPQTCLALKLMVLTFTRKKELMHAKWDEIDFENMKWNIPEERMKMRKQHLVPLSSQSITILYELKTLTGHTEYLFPSILKNNKPMHEDTILRAIYTLGYKGIATIHGFRALAMTLIMEKLGYRYEVPDLQLSHEKRGSLRKAYDRTEFIEERIKMMQDWGDYIDCIYKT